MVLRRFWIHVSTCILRSLRERCPNTEFFSGLYSVQIRGNTDQKKLHIWKYFSQQTFYWWELVGDLTRHIPEFPLCHFPQNIQENFEKDISLLALKSLHTSFSLFHTWYKYIFSLGLREINYYQVERKIKNTTYSFAQHLQSIYKLPVAVVFQSLCFWKILNKALIL